MSLILGPKKGIPAIAAARIQRWAIQLAAYTYEVKHRAGRHNENADALSRLPLQNDQDEGPVSRLCWREEATELNKAQINGLPITAKAICKETQRDPVLARVKTWVIQGWPMEQDWTQEYQPYHQRRNELTVEEGCLLWGVRTVIPPKFQSSLLEELHTCHPGIVRMKALARNHVWWPQIDRDIEDQVRSCKDCQEQQPKRPAVTDNPWKWPSGAWQRIHVDFAGPFMGDMFLVVVDAYSKWPEVVRMKSTTTETTIDALRQIFSQQGLPLELVSDNGPQFTSKEFEEFTKMNGIIHCRSAPFHPSTNGEAERFVRTFKTAMRARKNLKISVHRKLCDFLLAYRTTPHSATHRSPAELMGRALRTRLDAVRPNLAQRMERQTKQERATRHVEVGEPVLVQDYRSRKPIWTHGVVSRKLGPCTYLIEVGNLMWKRHIDQIIQNDKPCPGQQQNIGGYDGGLTQTIQMPLPSMNTVPQPSRDVTMESKSGIADEGGMETKVQDYESVPVIVPSKAKMARKDGVSNSPLRMGSPTDTLPSTHPSRARNPPLRLQDYVLE